MATLGRPATLKEFVIHSLLVWRDRDTLVDHDDEEPTRQLRRPDSDRPAGRRSEVFDLSFVPRASSVPSFADGMPTSLDAFRLPTPLPARTRHVRHRTAWPAAIGRLLLLAVVVVVALLMAR